MASEYDLLLEAPEQKSEYDALLEPATSAIGSTPQDQGSVAVQQPPKRTLLESLGRILGQARDIGTEALSEISPEMSARVFGQTAGSLRPEQIAPPLISPERAKEFIGELPAWAGGGTQFAKGATEAISGALSSFSTPGSLATLPAFAAPGVAETYALNVAAGLPKQFTKLRDTIAEFGLTSKETGAVAAESGIEDLMGFLAGKGGAKVRSLRETLSPITGERVARAEEPVRPVRGTVAEPSAAVPETPVEATPVEIAPGSPESVLATPVTPEAVPTFKRIAAAQRDLATARANGDTAAEARANGELEAVAAELIGGANKAVQEAQANVTTSEAINPVREVTPDTILHPDDTAMTKAAADSLGLRYDGVQEFGPDRPKLLNITNPATGDTYSMTEGSTVADLQSKIQEKATLQETGAADAAISNAERAAGVGPGETAGEIAGQENGPVASAPVAPDVAQSTGTGVNEPATTSVGPGAASITEPLASYEKRRFGERLQQDESIDPAIREQTANRYYEPISNKVTVAEAENIIERRGTDESIRLVRDEGFPMPPRVRVTVGEALIKKLNQSFEEATKAGDVRAPEFLEQAVDTAEYLSGYGTTLGQGVQAFAIWNKLTPEGRLLEAQRIAKRTGVELTPEQTKRIAEFNAEIENAPEGFQKDEKTQDLLSFMAEIKGANPADIPTALWYSNILSGFSTQLVNTIDTSLNVFSEAAAMAASHPSRIPDIVSGLYRGMIKGGFEAASVLKTGRSITGDKISQQRILERVKFGREGGVPISTETVLGRFMKGAFESKPAAILNLWKYPLRAMIASDTVFFNSFKEARARFLARGIAKTEGLSGDVLYRRVEEVLNQSTETVDAAVKQAQDEGLTGLNQRRRVGEIIDQGRSEGLTGDANEGAAIATYNHDPSGVLGLVAHNIANITEGFPLGKAIVPFTRIVANVANRGLNYTPWGYKRLFFGEWGGKKFASEPPAGDAYRAQLVKATLGTTAMTAVALLDANNQIQVTAKGPDNAEERKQLMNAGWKPYSVKVGDTYYSYQYTPFNLGFAMIGHYRDAIRYNKLSEKDAATRLAYGMLKSGSTIFDMSFLSGISDFIEAVQGNASSTKGAGRLLARTASSVLIPNLVKQIDKLFDATVYQADSITQSLIRETPVARSLTMKPMLNVLGEPIRPSSNRFFTFETNDPVWKFITDKQAWVSVPSKTSKIGNRPITSDEYYQLIQESGPMIRDYIQSNLGRLNEMSGEEAQKAIRKQSDHFRDVVKSRF